LSLPSPPSNQTKPNQTKTHRSSRNRNRTPKLPHRIFTHDNTLQIIFSFLLPTYSSSSSTSSSPFPSPSSSFSNLYACTLVCRHWSSIAIPILYSNPVISYKLINTYLTQEEPRNYVSYLTHFDMQSFYDAIETWCDKQTTHHDEFGTLEHLIKKRFEGHDRQFTVIKMSLLGSARAKRKKIGIEKVVKTSEMRELIKNVEWLEISGCCVCSGVFTAIGECCRSLVSALEFPLYLVAIILQ